MDAQIDGALDHRPGYDIHDDGLFLTRTILAVALGGLLALGTALRVLDR